MMATSGFAQKTLNFNQNNLSVDQYAQLNLGWQQIKEKGISKLEEYLSSGNKNIIFSK
jgi:hypothetical protein